jgi:hypothetical protein
MQLAPLQLGNPPTAAFAAPFLVSMQSVRVKCNPLSLAGVGLVQVECS